jgi:uncharacterized protein (TIGR02646 family)
MRHIVKSKEPQVLLDYKNKKGILATYKDMAPDDKDNLKSALSKEQYFICCYCMNRIKHDKSHIEHIKPQARFSREALIYHNLLVSCNGIKSKNNTCGHQKGGWYNEKEFLSPLDAECEKIYTYSINGQIDSLQKNGQVTINKLNLNSYQLVQARKAAIKGSGFFESDYIQKKQEILAYCTTPNDDNELPPFCMAIIYCVNNYL